MVEQPPFVEVLLDQHHLPPLDVLFVLFYLVNRAYEMVFQLVFRFEYDEALFEAVLLRAGEVTLLEVDLQVLVLRVVDVAVLVVVTNVALVVVFLEMDSKQIIIEEPLLAELG